MIDLFIKVKNHYEQKLPFALFCKPNSDRIVGLFQQDSNLYYLQNFKEKGFVFAAFDGDVIPYIPYKYSDVIIEMVSPADFYFDNDIITPTDEKAKIAFESLVQNGVEAIQNNQFQKVVLSRKERIVLNDFNLETVFKKLIHYYPKAYNYCFFHPKFGIWFGASPEQFLKINQMSIQTVALAGTKIVNGSEEVIWHEKEKEEQKIVTDFITSGLKEKVDDLVVSNPYSIKAGNLWHIKTDITATIKAGNTVAKIIESLHPTSAVCGLPKEEAKSFILNNEHYDREFYSGFLGEFNIDLATFRTDQSDLFVNLRCMKVVKNTALLFVGCGVTKDSIPVDEYQETVNKTMTMKKVL